MTTAYQSLVGILCIASSVTIFSLVAVLVKLVPEIPVDELTVLRYAVQWAIAAVFLAAASWRARKREEPAPWNGVTWLVISFMCVRSAGYFCMIYLMWSALRLLPVGDATILVYTSPLWTMLLSRMCLSWLLLISVELPYCLPQVPETAAAIDLCSVCCNGRRWRCACSAAWVSLRK